MAYRTTRKHLERLCYFLNILMLTREEDAYYIGYMMRKPRLHRRYESGESDISPRLPAGELYKWIHAYIEGALAKQAQYQSGKPLFDLKEQPKDSCDHSHKKRHSILYGCALLENE